MNAKIYSLFALMGMFMTWSPLHATEGQQTQKITQAIEKVRTAFGETTGMDITVVNRSKVLYQNRFGSADLSTSKKLGENTPFYIASTTKSLIATLILILQEESKINIDSPIKAYLPESFEFKDPALSVEWITVRDLLTHRSGIQNQIVEIRTSFTGQHTQETLLELFTQSRFSSRNHNYSNLNYILLGIIIDRTTDSSWQELLKEKLFVPLQMNHSTARFGIDTYNRIAKPHKLTSDRAYAVRPPQEMLVHSGTLLPSGGVFSTSDDLGKYLQFILNEGGDLLPSAQVQAALSSQTNTERNFPYSFYGYGLGWELALYKGLRLATHNGSNEVGYKSYMAISQELGLGISILSNENVLPHFTQTLIANYILNLETRPEEADIILEKEIGQFKERLEPRIQRRLSRTPPPDLFTGGLALSELPFEPSQLTGNYTNPIWGAIEIKLNEGVLMLEFGNIQSTGSMVKPNEFRMNFGFAVANVSFQVEAGKVMGLAIREIGAQFQKQ